MSRESNLVKNTAILSLGSFFPKFLTVLITPILTAQLTNAEYGEYDLISTIVSLLLPAVTLQISAAAFRFLIDKRGNKEEMKKIISTIFAFVIIISLITSVFYYILTLRGVGINGFIVCLYFLADILLITVQQIMRGLGKNMMYSLSTIIRAVLDVSFLALLTGVFGTINFGLNGVLWSMFLSTFFAFLFLLLKGDIFQYVGINHVNFVTLKSLLSYSWPMVPNNLSGWVLRLSDRLIITAVLGIEANAIYAVANKMPSIFSSFQNTFSLAWQENASIASKDTDKDMYYSQMCDGVYRLLTGLMAGLIMCTPIIWKILIKGNYDEAYYQVPILYIGMLFSCMSSTIGGIYIAHMKTKSVGITTMMAAGVNLVIDVLFVRIIGIWAGSISTMISYLFLLIYRMWDVQRFQKVEFNLKSITFGILFLALMSILNYQRNIICDTINVFICLFVLFLFDRNIIFGIVNKLLERIVKR